MKNILTLLILVAATTLSAQSTPPKTPACIIYINKVAKTDNAITAIELQSLGTLEVQDPRSEKRFRPSDFQWVISSNGSITKGTINQLYKINDMMPHLKPGAIVFIESIKFKEYTGICEGQWAFTLQ